MYVFPKNAVSDEHEANLAMQEQHYQRYAATPRTSTKQDTGD